MSAESTDPTEHVISHVLHGPDHTTLGQRAIRAVGDRAAIGLSPGRYPKAVPALDANEDAVVGLTGPAATVVAVADGHVGADAARAAIEAIATHAAGLVVEGRRERRRPISDLADAAADAVDDACRRASGERRDTATALSLVVVAERAVWTVTFGDTSVLRVRGDGARLISRTGPFLADAGMTPKPRRERLRPGDHVVALSDGVTDYLGRDWPVEVAHRVAGSADPAAAVESVLAGAMDGAAGDHLSCAVVRGD